MYSGYIICCYIIYSPRCPRCTLPNQVVSSDDIRCTHLYACVCMCVCVFVWLCVRLFVWCVCDYMCGYVGIWSFNPGGYYRTDSQNYLEVAKLSSHQNNLGTRKLVPYTRASSLRCCRLRFGFGFTIGIQ